MHGVTDSLPIGQFRGARLVALRPLENIFYFVFERAHSKLAFVRKSEPLSIGVEGMWQIRGGGGDLIASGNPIPESGLPAVQALLGELVVASEIRVPESFVLTLSSGHVLEVFDSNRQYESFSIPEANVYV